MPEPTLTLTASQFLFMWKLCGMDENKFRAMFRVVLEIRGMVDEKSLAPQAVNPQTEGMARKAAGATSTKGRTANKKGAASTTSRAGRGTAAKSQTGMTGRGRKSGSNT